jgi:four helix bundle protein
MRVAFDGWWHAAVNDLRQMRSVSSIATEPSRGRKCNIMANAIRSFRDLDVWRCGMDLVLLVYDLSDYLPDAERYGLRAQMRRAAVSIPSNVAEGHAFRTRPKAYTRHVRIALGSLAELETHIEIALRLKFLTAVNLKQTRGTVERTGQLLHGLLRALTLRKRHASECRVRRGSMRASKPIVSKRSSRNRVKARRRAARH